MEALRLADQRRFNRNARVLAWAISLLQPLIAVGVSNGIAAAFGEKVRAEPLRWDKVVMSIPHYEEDEEAREAKRRRRLKR